MLAARPLSAMLLSLLLLAGCRACDDDDAANGAEPLRESETTMERVRARMAGRRIDPSKVYPTLADGAADCGDDVDCFVVHADRCAPAVLDHTLRTIGIGVAQTVRSRFRIAGPEGADCRVLRSVFATEVEMAAAMREALQKRGSSADEVDANLDELKTQLRKNNPPRLECVMPRHRALETALDVAEGSHLGSRFHRYCHAVAPEQAWPDAPPPVSPAEPTAVPEKTAP